MRRILSDIKDIRQSQLQHVGFMQRQETWHNYDKLNYDQNNNYETYDLIIIMTETFSRFLS